MDNGQRGYSDKVVKKLDENGIIADIDSRNQPLSSRLKNAELIGIPYIAMFGSREADNSELLVRKPGYETLGSVDIDDLVTYLRNDDMVNKQTSYEE